MSRCCSPAAYGEFFDEKLARRDAARYRRKGATGATKRLVEIVTGRGVAGSTMLEIGGGTGVVQIELLGRGVRHATNVEISPGYEEAATSLLRERGLADRVDRHVADLAREPDAVEPADVVVLHRVVCCYPDYEGLLEVASEKARRVVAFSFPPDRVLVRIMVRVLNLWQRLRGHDFRSYVHSEQAMLDVVERRGFRLDVRDRGGFWRIAVLERS